MRNLKPREQPGGVRRRQLARGRAEIPAGVSGWGSGRLVGGEALQELGALARMGRRESPEGHPTPEDCRRPCRTHTHARLPGPNQPPALHLLLL